MPHNFFIMKTARQIEIAETALDLISEKGIQGMTMKNLSKKIGISEPAIYRHYENKIEILIAILDIFKENVATIFQQELHANRTALEKIEDLFMQHFNSFSRNPSLVSVIFSEEIFRNEPTLISKIYEVIEKNAAILRSIIQQGQARNEIRSDIGANHLAIVIMGSLRLFVKQWQFNNYVFDLNVKGKELVTSIINLLRAD